MRARNITKGTMLGDRIELADGVWSRFIGLIGRRQLPDGGGLLIVPSNGVHTLGMLFAIDVVFLDRGGRILEVRHQLAPFRITHLNWGAYSVLELPPGILKRAQTDLGDQLIFEK